MSKIQTVLERDVEVWAAIGLPDPLERFVLRNGEFQPGSPYPAERELMTPGHCFESATLLSQEGRGTYTEGFVLRENLPLVIHHAWVTLPDGTVFDPTLRPALNGKDNGLEYFGVKITPEEVIARIVETEHYGVLLNPSGIFPLDFYYARDPDLRGIVEGIIKKEQTA